MILNFDGNQKAPNVSKSQRKEILFVYEIYDLRLCELIPDVFKCRECLLKNMQVARKIVFLEDGGIQREVVCLPYKKKYLY